jgi:hypothetical protein
VEEVSISRKYLSGSISDIKKLITKTSLNKGNVLMVITSDDHVIYVKKEKSPTMRWHMDKKSWIMSDAKKPPAVITEAKH